MQLVTIWPAWEKLLEFHCNLWYEFSNPQQSKNISFKPQKENRKDRKAKVFIRVFLYFFLYLKRLKEWSRSFQVSTQKIRMAHYFCHVRKCVTMMMWDVSFFFLSILLMVFKNQNNPNIYFVIQISWMILFGLHVSHCQRYFIVVEKRPEISSILALLAKLSGI